MRMSEPKICDENGLKDQKYGQSMYRKRYKIIKIIIYFQWKDNNQNDS